MSGRGHSRRLLPRSRRTTASPTPPPPNNPVPTLTSISPTSILQGAANTPIALVGTNFIPSSVVRVNGTDITTSFADATHLSATIPASMLVNPASLSVTVFNPAPAGGTSNAQTFTVQSTALPPYTVAGLAYWLDPSRHSDVGAGSAAYIFSTMGAVTLVGTSPALTLSGVATQAVNLRVRIDAGGALGAATFSYSLDGSTTWTATGVLTAASVGPIAGITLAFAAGTYVLGDEYTANVRLNAAPSRESSSGVVDNTKTASQAAATTQLQLKMIDPSFGNKASVIMLGAQVMKTGTWGAAVPLPCTNYYVMISDSADASYRCITDQASGGNQHTMYKEGSNQFDFYNGLPVIVTKPPDVLSAHIVCVTVDAAGSANIYVDGASTVRATGSAGTGGASSRAFGGRGSSDLFWIGRMAGFLLYTGVHSLADRQTVGNYLAATYGLPWAA